MRYLGVVEVMKRGYLLAEISRVWSVLYLECQRVCFPVLQDYYEVLPFLYREVTSAARGYVARLHGGSRNVVILVVDLSKSSTDL